MDQSDEYRINRYIIVSDSKKQIMRINLIIFSDCQNALTGKLITGEGKAKKTGSFREPVLNYQNSDYSLGTLPEVQGAFI